jgi:uncharacterized membrane protein
MLLVILFLALIGLFVIILGITIWRKQKITWVSMRLTAKNKDVEAFTKSVGKSTIGIGFSVLCMGIFFAINLIIIGLIVFAVCFIASFSIYLIAQAKYNGTETPLQKYNSNGTEKWKNSNTRIILICVFTSAIFATVIVSQSAAAL